MERIIRVVLLGVIVVLGFTAVFPEWLDFLVMERTKRIEQQQVYEMSRRPVSPKNWHLAIEGAITANTDYAVTVRYEAKNQSRFCQDYNLFSDETSQEVQLKHYNPTIKNGRHSIVVPLKEFSPLQGCQFVVYEVSLMVFTMGSKATKSDLLFVEDGVNYSAYNNSISIECAEYYGRYGVHGSRGCYKAPFDKKRKIVQQLPIANSEWTININLLDTGEFSRASDLQREVGSANKQTRKLCTLMHRFDYMNNENPAVSLVPASEAVGNRVLQGDFDGYRYGNQTSAIQFHRSLLVSEYENIARSIRQNSNKQFIDPWKRPYEYKLSQDGKGYAIVSKGENETDVSDDIYRKCRG